MYAYVSLFIYLLYKNKFNLHLFQYNMKYRTCNLSKTNCLVYVTTYKYPFSRAVRVHARTVARVRERSSPECLVFERALTFKAFITIYF